MWFTQNECVMINPVCCSLLNCFCCGCFVFWRGSTVDDLGEDELRALVMFVDRALSVGLS